MRPRDSQRQAVYRWEKYLEQNHPACLAKIELGECQRIVTQVLADNGQPWRATVVTDGRRRHVPCFSPASNTIKLPKWARYSIIVLHEVAHAMASSSESWHGPEFATRVARLWETYCGIPLGESLRVGKQQTPRAVKFA